MPIIPTVGKHSARNLLAYAFIYLILLGLGATMVVPFLITVNASLANEFDFNRYDLLPRYLISRPYSYVRSLVGVFSRYPKWPEQARAYFPEMPDHWTSWRDIGRDLELVEQLGNARLAAATANWELWQKIAADYSEFNDQCPSELLLAPVTNLAASGYLEDKYRLLWRRAHPEASAGKISQAAVMALLSERWGYPMENVYAIDFEQSDMLNPFWQQSFNPEVTPKYLDFQEIIRAYSFHVFTPGIAAKWRRFQRREGIARPFSLEELLAIDDPERLALWRRFKAEQAPCSPAHPLASRAIWHSFLTGEKGRRMLGLKPVEPLSVEYYNQRFGTAYRQLGEIPFPVPEDAPEDLRRLWRTFVCDYYPLRLTSLAVTPELAAQYRAFLENRLKSVTSANQLLGTECRAWNEFTLAPRVRDCPTKGLRDVWLDFVKQLPCESRIIHSSEGDYQRWLLAKYGSLEKINAAYGWQLARIEEAFPPLAIAQTVTFIKNERALRWGSFVVNYRFVLAFLLGRGRALFVTFILIAATVLTTLTINPLAAYALSRFNLRGKDKILLFMLATMAFPAMVSAIPAYLLMRDLGLLNTFFALLLPGAANGMSIFILKGFFDSLPRELYEAATIDGAQEWQIFTIVTLPMMKPILAINALTAFLAAYSGWEWALIICQDPNMWTLSVWMYQANLWWSSSDPWLVNAGFVVVSVPTLLAFLFCQKIILEGIIVPSMK